MKDAEREVRIRTADADAKAGEGENLAKATIAASQATLQVKKAEAYEMGETRKARAEAAVLEAEHLDHLVEASAKAISNIKFDKVVLWEGNGANGSSATANWLHNMARTLPPMMQVTKDIGGVEIPETLATLIGAGRPVEDTAAGQLRGKRPQASDGLPVDKSATG